MNTDQTLYAGWTPTAAKPDQDEVLFASIRFRLQGKTVPEFITQIVRPALTTKQHGAATSVIKHYEYTVMPMIRELQKLRKQLDGGKFHENARPTHEARWNRKYSETLYEIERMLGLWYLS